jgi:hypothetical protein
MQFPAPCRAAWIWLAVLVAAGAHADLASAQPFAPVPRAVAGTNPLAAAAAAALEVRGRSSGETPLPAVHPVPPPPPAAVALPLPESAIEHAAESLPGVAEVGPPVWFPTPPRRPSLLVPLYLSFAALQVADVASTGRALDAGGQEANPLVSGFADSSAKMLVVKAGATAGTIYLTERLWKKNRPAAVVLMVALNGAYGAIVAHNYRQSAQSGQR